MLLRWTPPDGEAREFQLTPAKMTTVDAEAVEAVGGEVWDNFDDFARAFNARNRRALRAALWVCLRRADGDRAPRFDALSVGAYDVHLDLGDDELAVIRNLLVSGQEIDPVQREAFVAMLGEDPAAAGPKDSPSVSPEPGSD